MKAEDTVMDNLDEYMDNNRWMDLAYDQAEISFKAGCEQGGLDSYAIDFAEGKRTGIREVVEFAEKFLTLAEHGDYSNGNEAFGVDEGRVRARELLDQYRKEWQAQVKEWGIE